MKNLMLALMMVAKLVLNTQLLAGKSLCLQVTLNLPGIGMQKIPIGVCADLDATPAPAAAK